MDKCEKCLYKENCQFLATHKGAIVADCTAYKDAANVVEVVRCKDCKHYRDWGDYTTCMKWTVDYDVPTGPNAFCSYGERKENEQREAD